VQAFTPAERRGALLVALLLALGAAHDLWRASRPLPASAPLVPVAPAVADSARDLAPERRPGLARALAPTDLNRASAHELDALPGVGPVLAARIIAHRPFRRREELMAVRGIGPRLYARLAPLVTVGEVTGPEAAAPSR